MLNPSFPTGCSSASETIGFSEWSKVEHEELYQDISSSVYLSVRHCDGCNERMYTKNLKFYTHLETHAQSDKLW